MLRAALANPEAASPTTLAADVATLAAPALSAAVVAALAAGMSQTGLVFAARPTARAGRLFDALRAHDALRALVAATAVAALGWRAVASGLPAAATAAGRPNALL